MPSLDFNPIISSSSHRSFNIIPAYDPPGSRDTSREFLPESGPDSENEIPVNPNFSSIPSRPWINNEVSTFSMTRPRPMSARYISGAPSARSVYSSVLAASAVGSEMISMPYHYPKELYEMALPDTMVPIKTFIEGKRAMAWKEGTARFRVYLEGTKKRKQ